MKDIPEYLGSRTYVEFKNKEVIIYQDRDNDRLYKIYFDDETTRSLYEYLKRLFQQQKRSQNE